MRTPRPLRLALYLAVRVAAACAPAPDDGERGQAAPATSAPPPAAATRPGPVPHDPPAWFDAGRKVTPPGEATRGRLDRAGRVRSGNGNGSGDGSSGLPIALHGTRAFLASPDGLQVFDLATGRSEEIAAPEGKAQRPDSGQTALAAPLVTDDQVLISFLLAMPPRGNSVAGGHGRTRRTDCGRPAHRLLAERSSNSPSGRPGPPAGRTDRRGHADTARDGPDPRQPVRRPVLTGGTLSSLPTGG